MRALPRGAGLERNTRPTSARPPSSAATASGARALTVSAKAIRRRVSPGRIRRTGSRSTACAAIHAAGAYLST